MPVAILFATAFLASCQSESFTAEEEGEIGRDGIELAMRYERKITMDPALNRVPSERLQAAEARANALAGTGRINALTWQERGPNNIGGRTRAMIIDRRDATGNTVLAASVSGGIFRTTNFTSATPNFAPVNDQMQNLAVTALVQDAVNPAIMYAGTGEGWFNVDAVQGAGIFKSTDGGLTWAQLPSTTNFEFVQDVATDQFGNLYATLRNVSAAGARGVQRSTDGGTSWVQVLGAPLPNFATGRAADLEVASNGDIYATLGVFSRTQVFKSTFSVSGVNTGAAGTWTNITPTTSSTTQRGELAVSQSNPNRLFLAVQDSATQGVYAIFRSSNAGATWDSLGTPGAILNGSAPQVWYNLIVAINPTNPDDVVVGALSIGRSTDAGANFTNISTPSGVHPDQHFLQYFGASNLYVGNDGGLWFSNNANTASPTFTSRNNNYNVTQYYGCDFHPTQPDYFLAGAQDNSSQKFTQPGINSTPVVGSGDGMYPHIDQTDGQLQITAAQFNQYFRSLNGGGSFTFLSGVSNGRGGFVNPTDLDDNLKTLYCGDDPGKYYVIQNLTLASPSGTQRTSTNMGVNREVSTVKVDPFVPGTIYIGTTVADNATANVVPIILKIANANSTFPTEQMSTLPGVPAGATISSIDVDPVNGDHLLATVSNYGVTSVFESTNGGLSFTSIEGNLPDMPVRWGIFVAPTAQLNGPSGGNGGILLATETGVWSTSAINGAATQWIPNRNGLPNVRTDQLKYRTTDGLVAAATHGRGLFTTIVTGGTVTTAVSALSNTRDFIRYISATPNDLLVVPGTLSTRKVSITVLDSRGSQVLRAESPYQSFRLPTQRLTPGVYIIRIVGDRKEIYTGRFVKR
ncbi:MAG: type sorting protein [Flaviaesturariibacter sp.]|nr:type sorting protein [Flaviaesturariibacter sp.]